MTHLHRILFVTLALVALSSPLRAEDPDVKSQQEISARFAKESADMLACHSQLVSLQSELGAASSELAGEEVRARLTREKAKRPGAGPAMAKLLEMSEAHLDAEKKHVDELRKLYEEELVIYKSLQAAREATVAQRGEIHKKLAGSGK